MTDNELFDQFLSWIEKPYEEYSRNEIQALWEEFHRDYPEGIEPWREDSDEDFYN